MSPAPEHFTFRKHDSIGAAAAEEDDFLSPCFVDTGDLAALKDCANSKRIVVGRTGAGKSALLRTVADRCDHVIELSPQGLSLNYIANNTVIRFFEEAGVNLTPFYILLWKHVLVVELLRAKYQITTEDSARRTMTRLRDILYRKDHIKDQAVAYLETWGNRFWLTSEERMKQLTERVESSLSGSLGGLRPRDAIQFLNECIARAEGRPRITAHTIKAAEEAYSIKRLQSLAYEWQIIYPNLNVVARMLHGLPASFPLSHLTKEFVEEKFQAAVGESELMPNDPNTDQLNALYTPQGNFNSIRNLIVRNLYRVGLLGIKGAPTSAVSWSADARSSLGPGELRPAAQIHIHPMFQRALGVRT